MRANRDTLNMDEVKRYFVLFELEPLFDEHTSGTSKDNARLSLPVAEGGVEYSLSESADPFAA